MISESTSYKVYVKSDNAVHRSAQRHPQKYNSRRGEDEEDVTMTPEDASPSDYDEPRFGNMDSSTYDVRVMCLRPSNIAFRRPLCRTRKTGEHSALAPAGQGGRTLGRSAWAA